MANQEPVHELKKTADWKTAYVIGLAGVLLVTGADPPTIGSAGGLGWIVIITTVIIGAIYCFFLAELATRFPEKTGGLPTYAIEGFRDKKWGGLLGGINNWAYWLGWFPVVCINAALMAVYAATLGGFYNVVYNGVLPNGFIGYAYILAFTAAIAGILWVVNYMGLSMGFGVCLILGILSIVPLLAIGFVPLATVHVAFANIFPINSGGYTINGWGDIFWNILPWYFIMTWNALAMETAACYIGECKNPRKDAPRALIAEGVTGIVVYTMVGLTLLGYLGFTAVAADPWASFIKTLNFLGPYASPVVGICLFAALLLSTLGAFLGCCRALYQSSIEGLTLRWFGKLNKHGAPVRACTFSFFMVLLVSLIAAGLPTLIYVLSNVGYLLAFIPTGLAFIRLKMGYKGAPQIKDPSKVFILPKWMAGVAAVIVAFFIFIWAVMGPISGYTVYAVGGLPVPAITFWLIGIFIVLVSIPMYYRRQGQERKLAASKLVQNTQTVTHE